jgi:tRNA-splicing ligase RtcB
MYRSCHFFLSGLQPCPTMRVQAINCHHNYVARERHYGQEILVTRKGAVRAREGDLGLIPGSMGARSFIVRGKGNPESFSSCSHGAGRAKSDLVEIVHTLGQVICVKG